MLSIEEGLFYQLSGYTKEDPATAENLITDNWAAYAQKELERRRFKLIESLPEKELHAIANGEIDLNDIIRRAADSHKK